ncbi:hypothetical protein SAMN04487829_2065 [Pseudobutyrivibrio sp. NOR37]|uniref:Uncharacterized protein n=1 Tax=Pseudobutyrivibrio xylanivorans TaxID=185007 RepID=A0A6M0LKU2_PSEXY|nr:MULTISPECIES: hypothetical protein [Pseudobutyrivibrio]NEX02437.1 hypothetical protein [Pseudobutyrivibrio xylanivorans]SFR79205.1 hypothetical protein SAMN04487829_2065 [Pseudobutyrivibrio sp. NOR37]
MKKREIGIAIICAAIFGYSLSTTVVAAEETIDNNICSTSCDDNHEDSLDSDEKGLSSDASETETENEDFESSDSAAETENEDLGSDDSETETKNEDLDSDDSEVETENDALDTSDSLLEVTEESCTDICHIDIIYNQEYYVIENLCPTGELEVMELSASFSVKKGEPLAVDLDNISPEVKKIISSVDQLSNNIDNSFEIRAYVYADNKVKIESISKKDVETVSCQVTVISDSKDSDDSNKEDTSESETPINSGSNDSSAGQDNSNESCNEDFSLQEKRTDSTWEDSSSSDN